jgi:hypothetical protein
LHSGFGFELLLLMKIVKRTLSNFCYSPSAPLERVAAGGAGVVRLLRFRLCVVVAVLLVLTAAAAAAAGGVATAATVRLRHRPRLWLRLEEAKEPGHECGAYI